MILPKYQINCFKNIAINMPNSRAVILYLVVIFTCYCMVILAIHDDPPPFAVIHGACHCKKLFLDPLQHVIIMANISVGSSRNLELKIYFLGHFRIFFWNFWRKKYIFLLYFVYFQCCIMAKKSLINFDILPAFAMQYVGINGQKCVTLP